MIHIRHCLTSENCFLIFFLVLTAGRMNITVRTAYDASG